MASLHSLRQRIHKSNPPGVAMDATEYFRTKVEYEISPAALKARMAEKEVLVLDVRDRESFAKEHIAGARNIPLEEIHKSFASLPDDKTIVAYCWSFSCQAAARAAIELAQKGFQVQELIGGIEEWKRLNFPVE